MNEIPQAKANVGLSIQVWAEDVISSELTGLMGYKRKRISRDM